MTLANADQVETPDETLVVDPADEGVDPAVLEADRAITEPPTPEVAALTAVETPAPGVTPEPPAPALPATGMSEAERFQYNQALQQNAQYAQQVEVARQAEDSRNIAAQMVDTLGMTEEQAASVVSLVTQANQRATQAENRALLQAQHLQGKTSAAMHYSQQYSIPPQDLMVYDSPQAMENHAKLFKELHDLKQKVSAQTRAQVPVQTFDSAQTTAPPASDRDARMDYLASKPGAWTDAEIVEYNKLTG
mgnify:CR=1 FL=1